MKEVKGSLKRLFYILILVLFLAGCQSKWEKMERAAFEDLEEHYHLTDMEVVSMERVEPVGIPLSIYVLNYIFNGSDYKVKVRVQEDVPVVVEGTMNERKRYYEGENYIPAKHEALQENDEDYEKIVNQIEEMEISEVAVYSHAIYTFYKEGIRTLQFKMTADELDIESEVLVRKLHVLADQLLENVESNMMIELTVPVHTFRFQEFSEKERTIEIAPVKEEKMAEKLKSQLHFALLSTKVDSSFKEELESLYKVSLSSSLYEQIFDPESDDTLFRHEMDIAILEGFEDEEIIDLIIFLKEAGLGESFVQFTFIEGTTDFCQVKEVESLDDYDRCFNTIKLPSYSKGTE